MEQSVRFFKQVSHWNKNSFRLHAELPPISDLVTSEMINDVKTEADRCDKDNVEWLINLVGRRKYK